MFFNVCYVTLFQIYVFGRPVRTIADTIEASYAVPDLHVYPIRKRELTCGRKA